MTVAVIVAVTIGLYASMLYVMKACTHFMTSNLDVSTFFTLLLLLLLLLLVVVVVVVVVFELLIYQIVRKRYMSHFSYSS